MTDEPHEINAEHFSVGSLMAGLMCGEIPLPVWIRCGRSRHRVTPETKDAFCRGLLLALEMNT